MTCSVGQRVTFSRDQVIEPVAWHAWRSPPEASTRPTRRALVRRLAPTQLAPTVPEKQGGRWRAWCVRASGRPDVRASGCPTKIDIRRRQKYSPEWSKTGVLCPIFEVTGMVGRQEQTGSSMKPQVASFVEPRPFFSASESVSPLNTERRFLTRIRLKTCVNPRIRACPGNLKFRPTAGTTASTTARKAAAPSASPPVVRPVIQHVVRPVVRPPKLSPDRPGAPVLRSTRPPRMQKGRAGFSRTPLTSKSVFLGLPYSAGPPYSNRTMAPGRLMRRATVSRMRKQWFRSFCSR